jgi:hypothetical protein
LEILGVGSRLTLVVLKTETFTLTRDISDDEFNVSNKSSNTVIERYVYFQFILIRTLHKRNGKLKEGTT